MAANELELAVSALMHIRDSATDLDEAQQIAGRALHEVTTLSRGRRDPLDLREPVPSTEPGYEADEAMSPIGDTPKDLQT